MVFFKTKGQNIEFFGNCLAESTAYFLNIIFNIIFKPIIEIKLKKNIPISKLGVLSLQAYLLFTHKTYFDQHLIGNHYHLLESVHFLCSLIFVITGNWYCGIFAILQSWLYLASSILRLGKTFMNQKSKSPGYRNLKF